MMKITGLSSPTTTVLRQNTALTKAAAPSPWNLPTHRPVDRRSHIDVRIMNPWAAVAPASLTVRAKVIGPFGGRDKVKGLAWRTTVRRADGQPLKKHTKCFAPVFAIMGWNDPSVQYTPELAAADCRTPGRYIIRVEVSDGHEVLAAEVVQDVADTNVVFAGSKTICFDPTGQFGWGPPGARQVRTRDALRWEVSGSPASRGADIRVLFKAGAAPIELATGDALLGRRLVNVGRLLLDVWGEGPHQRFTSPAGQGSEGIVTYSRAGRTDGAFLKLHRLHWDGAYDTQTEHRLPRRGGLLGTEGGTEEHDTSIEVIDCIASRSSHIGLLYQHGFGAGQVHCHVIDSAVVGFAEYGIFAGDNDFLLVLGSLVWQEATSRNGGVAVHQNGHGPCRIGQGRGGVLVAFSFMHSNNGRGGLQPPLRCMTSGIPGEMVRLCGNVLSPRHFETDLSPSYAFPVTMDIDVRMMFPVGRWNADHTGIRMVACMYVEEPRACSATGVEDNPLTFRRLPLENDFFLGYEHPVLAPEFVQGRYDVQGVTWLHGRRPEDNGGHTRPAPADFRGPPSPGLPPELHDVSGIAYLNPNDGADSNGQHVHYDMGLLGFWSPWRGKWARTRDQQIAGTGSPEPDWSDALHSAMVDRAMPAGTRLAKVAPLHAVSGYTGDPRFTLDAEGYIARTATGTLAAGDMVRMQVMVDVAGLPVAQPITVIAHDGPTRPTYPIVVPLPSAPDYAPGETRPRIDFAGRPVPPTGPAKRGALAFAGPLPSHA